MWPFPIPLKNFNYWKQHWNVHESEIFDAINFVPEKNHYHTPLYARLFSHIIRKDGFEIEIFTGLANFAIDDLHE